MRNCSFIRELSATEMWWKVTRCKHKKIKQALGRSLRNLFEQLAWRTSPAAVLLMKQKGESGQSTIKGSTEIVGWNIH